MNEPDSTELTAKRKKRIIILSIIGLALVAVIIWAIWGNTALEQNSYIISSPKLPSAFNGFRIAHISDLHNTEMGDGNKKLLSMLEEAEPDIIAITGDMIDSRNTKVEIALNFAQEAVKIAPCYYVTGNHESRVSEYAQLKAGLEAVGVVILDNKRTEIALQGQTIALLGVDDPSFNDDPTLVKDSDIVSARLNDLIHSEDAFAILLCHRPELFDTYVSHGIDLALSGHAHGGQFRLPFIGGLVAPNQGFFPQYDAGLYTKNDTHMLVSRGIGNSIIPLRFNNRPEVILIELKINN